MADDGYPNSDGHAAADARLHVRIVAMTGFPTDYGSLFAASLRGRFASVEVDGFTHIEPRALDRARARMIRQKLVPRSRDEIVVFVPGLREYYAFGPHVSVQFSGYTGQRRAPNLLVLPHPWHLATPDREAIAWNGRPPLTIGFTGATYRASRVARWCGRLPRPARRWILGGGLVRSLERYAACDEFRVPITVAPAFPRFQAIDAVLDTVGRHAGAEAKVIDTVGFARTEANVRMFKDNLLWSTYVLCPRGIENYSFRVYEALRFGRVPVIIDSDMLLPDRETLEQLAIIVPYDDLASIMDAVAHDHARHDAAAFAARQQRALAYSAELLEGAWLGPRLRDAIEQARAADPRF